MSTSSSDDEANLQQRSQPSSPAVMTPPSSPPHEPASSPGAMSLAGDESSVAETSASSDTDSSRSSSANSPPKRGRKEYTYRHSVQVPHPSAYSCSPVIPQDLRSIAEIAPFSHDTPLPGPPSPHYDHENEDQHLSELSEQQSNIPEQHHHELLMATEHDSDSNSSGNTVAISESSEAPSSVLSSSYKGSIGSSSGNEEVAQTVNAGESDSCDSSDASSSDWTDGGHQDDSSDSSGDEPMNLRKLYTNAKVSVDETVVLIMDLLVNEQLKKSTIDKILKMEQKLLPQPNLLPKNKDALFKYVKNHSVIPEEKVYYYCKECHYYIGVRDAQCKLCKSASNKFYQLSIREQIKNLFENQNLASHIDSYAEVRIRREEAGLISDICDGSECKRAQIPGQYNLVLLGHTDGVALTKSSDASLSPVEFVICDLPPKLRFRFVIIAGVWLDSHKPFMNTYLKPIVEELRDIYVNGITWVHPKTQCSHKSYVVAPGFCADAPVRAQLQNILSHGGRYSCNLCEQKMLKLPGEPDVPGVERKKRRRVYSFKEIPSSLRTNERMKDQAKISQGTRVTPNQKLVAKRGVRGKSILSKIPLCDRSTAVFPEYMHLLLGIIKTFMTLWFLKDGPWSLKQHRDQIDLFLKNIRVPDFVTRIPRSTKHFAKWKANELRSFLLYYSLIIFYEVMETKYFEHWLLFVSAVYILLEETITETDIDRADIMLRMFLRDFSMLYQPDDFTYNLHNVEHLGLLVKRWGNLWSNSAFPFENFNGILVKYIHGSKNQAQELINTVKLNCGVQILRARLDIENSKTVDVPADCGDVIEFRNEVKPYYKWSALETRILRLCNITPPLKVWYRAVVGKEIFTTSIYTRQFRRNNFTVCYKNSSVLKYGEIQCFFESDEKKMAFIRPFVIEHLRVFSLDHCNVLVKHAIPVKEQISELDLVPMSSVLFKVIRVGDFVCLRPNRHEVNL